MAERVVTFIFLVASMAMVALGAGSLGGTPAVMVALGACFFFCFLMFAHADLRERDNGCPHDP